MRRSYSEKLVHQLDWNLLRTFLVIVQEGGITHAARRLMLQQPAVSLALKRLEERFGEKLIERRSGVFKVTPAGELLYQECVKIYASISRLASTIDDVHDELSGHIQLAHASHVGSPIVDEVISGFHRRHPRVTFSVEVCKSSKTTRALLDQQISFGVILVSQKNPALDYLHVYREFFGFFCGPTHRLFGREDVAQKELEGESTVSFSADVLSDVLRPLALQREELGFDPHIVATSTHLEEVRRMIIAGLGIGPIPLHIAERDERDGLLWRLPPYDNPVPMDVYLAWNPETRFNKAEAAFLDNFREVIEARPLETRIYPAGMAQ